MDKESEDGVIIKEEQHDLSDVILGRMDLEEICKDIDSGSNLDDFISSFKNNELDLGGEVENEIFDDLLTYFNKKEDIHIIVIDDDDFRKKCKYCSEVFVNDEELKQHIKVHFKTSIEHLVKRKTEDDLVCKDCGEKFDTLISSKMHIECKRLDQSKVLPEKSQKSKKKKAKDSSKSKKNNLQNNINKNFKCPYCTMSFWKLYNLEKHVEDKHEPEEQHKCDLCRFATSQISKLEKHKNTHSKRFVCDHCQKKFIIKTKLITHIQCVHMKIKPYCCQKCGAKFYYKTLLNKHMPKHIDGEFICDVCRKVFTERRYFIRHFNKVHAPYEISCVKCNKICPSRGEYKNHKIKEHSRKKEYKCDMCNFVTNTYRRSRNHSKIHDAYQNMKEVYKFHCKQCLAGFKTSNGLKKHLVTHVTDSLIPVPDGAQEKLHDFSVFQSKNTNEYWVFIENGKENENDESITLLKNID